MQPTRAAPLRVLIVDDNETCLIALSRLLRLQGYDVRCARTVEDAYRQAVAEPPDVLVSDLDLTDGDGCELLRRLRALRPQVQGVAVCGFAGGEHERQCREAGYAAFLSKPLVFE